MTQRSSLDSRERYWWILATVGLSVVLAVGLGMACAFLNSGVPTWDDTEILAPYWENSPPVLEWVFKVHSGHFAPITKAILVGEYALSMKGAWVSPYLLPILTLAGILLVLRGLSWSKCGESQYFIVLPILVLNTGFLSSYLRPVLVYSGLYGAGVGYALCVVLRDPPGERQRTRWSLLLLSLGLSLTSGHGLILAWCIVLALLGHGVGDLKSHISRIGKTRGPLAGSMSNDLVVRSAPDYPPQEQRQSTRYLFGLLLAFIALVSFTILGLSGDVGGGRTPSASAMLKVALQALGQGFGPIGSAGWTTTGYGVGVPPLFSIAMILLLTGGALALIRIRMASTGNQRLFLWVAGALLASIPTQALVIGVTRAGLGSTFGTQLHYGLFMSWGAVVCFVLFAVSPPSPTMRCAQFAVLCLGILCVVFNAQVGWRDGKIYKQTMEQLSLDAMRGDAPEELAKRLVPFLHPREEDLRRVLTILRENGRPPFSVK